MNARFRMSPWLIWLLVVGILPAATLLAQDSKTPPRRPGATEPALRGKVTSLPTPAFADVKYGSHERNVLDFWKAESDKPAPTIVYIHGGGFVGGDKRSFSPQLLQESLAVGISCAAIHYRFVGDGVTFPAPQQDGARAIQFLRHKASEWNIDPSGSRRLAAPREPGSRCGSASMTIWPTRRATTRSNGNPAGFKRSGRSAARRRTTRSRSKN